MVDVNKRRSEFSIFVVDVDPASGNEISASLRTAGYADCRYFPTLESAMAIARESLPHVVIVDYDGFESGVDGFMAEIHALSAETLVIPILPAALKFQGLQFVTRALAYDSITKPLSANLELIQKVDRAVAQLYFQFESEQIRDHYEAEGDSAESSSWMPLRTAVASSGASAAPGPLDFEFLRSTLETFEAEKDLDKTVSAFMDGVTRVLNDVPVLYFRYVPAHMTFLFARATMISSQTFRGIGIDLKKEDPRNLPVYFENPGEIPALKTMVQDLFARGEFLAFPHADGADVHGLFVILGPSDLSLDDNRLVCLRHIFDLAYRRNLTLKEKHNLEITDAATGVFNRRHFSKLLGDEISRARRLTMPLTLIVIEVDRAKELLANLGARKYDVVLKSVAGLLRKTARTNDIVARISPDGFACLLPHTQYRGGAIKAERFRRLVEGAKLPFLEEPRSITISCGVSEYPSFCGDAESLIESADEALHEVQSSGGNKVCLTRSVRGFQKDFEPILVPTTPRLGSGV